MTRASILFLCDGAAKPAAWDGIPYDRELSLSYFGTKANLNLRIENLSHALLASIDDRAADLVRIASYVYAADQTVSRGGQKDIYGESWRRDMHLAIPVSDPKFWGEPGITSDLQDIIHFLSNDRWRFSFVSGIPGGGQLMLNTNKQELHGAPDSVVMLSGGADSLAAAVEAFCGLGLRPLLVSHRSAPPIDVRQSTLVAELRRRFGDWAFPHISCWVHRKGRDAAETTQRVRSFLFASLGAAVASSMGITRLIFSDNGVVSLNLPVNRQLLGALATRSTHPKFIWLFNRLLSKALSPAPIATNTLADRTRAETIGLLKQHGVSDLLPHTVSCVRVRGRPSDQLHCGVCSQCVDRRFAVIANDMDELEPPQRYGLDIFKDPLPEGEARTLATSYIRFAREVNRSSDDEMFVRYPELGECILPDDANPSATAERLAGLLRRQAEGVLSVYSLQVTASQAEITNGWLKRDSLIALCSFSGASDYADGADGIFVHDDNYTNVRFKDCHYAFTTTQAQVVRLLDQARLDGLPEMRQADLGRKMKSPGIEIRNVFRNSAAFRVLVVSGSRKGTYRLNL